jgi:hypothetical protein
LRVDPLKLDQQQEPGAALDQRGDPRHSLAQQQVAFPMAGHRPVISLSRPLADVHDAGQLAASIAAQSSMGL